MFKASRDMNIDRKRLMQWVKPRNSFVQCRCQKNQKETWQPGGYPQESGFEQPLYDWFCRLQQNVWLNYRLIRIYIRSFVRTIGKKIRRKVGKFRMISTISTLKFCSHRVQCYHDQKMFLKSSKTRSQRMAQRKLQLKLERNLRIRGKDNC